MVEKINEVDYEPISVREALLQMKDISELMIDLAYYATLFHDKEIAGEVMQLEKRIDRLNYLLLMNASLAVRDKEDAESMAGIMRTASAANKISDAAADIANTAILGVGLHPTIKKVFQKVEERIATAELKSNSILVDKTPEQLKLQTTIGIDIIAIRRKSHIIINPSPKEKLKMHDVLIVRGSDIGTNQLKQLAQADIQEIP